MASVFLNGRPIDGYVGVNNPDGFSYIKGAENVIDSWRMRVAGEPPDTNMRVEHFETLIEVDIDLDEQKVSSLRADNTITENNIYRASVLTDTRNNQNNPSTLSGSMAGRVITYDGTIFANFDDQWILKGDFSNSFFSDRGVFRRMNIINTDPDDGFVYPPTPLEGVTLGTRFADFEGTTGAHLTLTTGDGIFGALPVVIHGGPVAFNLPPDLLNTLKEDGTVIGIEYQNYPNSVTNYNLADKLTVSGRPYLSLSQGFQSFDFLNNIDLWEPQDRDLVMNSALITQAGGVISDNAGNILRGFST